MLALQLVGMQAWSQDSTKWSLERCITYALENNITIKRQTLSVQQKENQYKQSKFDRLPDLNANMNGGLNYGYTWVQQEAQNVNKNTRAVNTSISSNMPLFAGLNAANTIKKNEFDWKSALENTKKTENDITLQLTGQFLQVLFGKELLAVAKEQLLTSALQTERTKKMVDAGSVAMGNLLEMKSQMAKDALNVTTAENNLTLYLLNLAQLLDLQNTEDFDIETPIIADFTEFATLNPGAIYIKSLEIMPEIKGSEYNLTSTQYELKRAKSGYYPTLSLNASIGGNANWLVDDVNNYNRPLFSQLESTRNTYVGLSLRIPIFNKFQNKTRVSNAQLGLMDAQYQLQAEKLNLRKEIQQAYADATASYKKYLASEDAVNSFQESFKYTEQKYNVGLVNMVDYSVAKTDYTKAQSDLLQAKYEYILRTKILDFYNGLPIQL